MSGMARLPKPALSTPRALDPELQACLRELERASTRRNADLAVASRRRQIRWLLSKIDRVSDTPRPGGAAGQSEGALWSVAAELAHVVARLGEVGHFLGVFADEAEAEERLGVRI